MSLGVNAFVANIDGGARGNPGPAGWGVIVRTHDGEPVAELSGAMPHATNNVAEYQGLIEALGWCARQRATEVEIRSDSLLLVQQMRGAYKVKSEGLKALHARACALALEIGHVEFRHVPREENRDADRLANRAMDEAALVTPGS